MRSNFTSMSAVLKHYRKDLWLRRPLDRDFTMAKMVKWIEKELPALGGIVSKEYAQRDYDVVMDQFVALMVDFVGFTIRKDRSVSQQLLAARVDEVQAENLGKGELLWLEDPVGAAPSNGPIQARYEALEGGEKQQFDWLQALTQDFVLYKQRGPHRQRGVHLGDPPCAEEGAGGFGGPKSDFGVDRGACDDARTVEGQG